MVAVKEREAMTDGIESLLSDYCRAGCPHYAKSKVCNNTCPIGQELLAYGSKLGGDEKMVRNGWSSEEEQKLIDLRTKGMMYKEISIALGRSMCSVDRKVRGLRKDGRLS